MNDKRKTLISYLDNCPEIVETLNKCTEYGLQNYYLAGGVITQLIWSNLLGKPNLDKVKDFDIVYYSDTEERGLENLHEEHIRNHIKHQFPLDIKNQAYVHEWYPKKFGNEIDPFNRTENGIETWLPAFAIGIRKTNQYEIFAPYGLEDAFEMIVRPNKLTMSKENYTQMTENFKTRWPDITILLWD